MQLLSSTQNCAYSNYNNNDDDDDDDDDDRNNQ